MARHCYRSMLVSFFGSQLLAAIGQVPVPVFARATGDHLATVEHYLHTGLPPYGWLQVVAALSQEGWFWDMSPIPVETLSLWVERGGVHPESQEVEVTWDEMEVLQTEQPYPDSTLYDWLRQNPVFTIEAFTKTWKFSSQDEAVTALQGTRWRPKTEWVGDKQLRVWRWNPLGLSPMGRPLPRPHAKPGTTPVESMAPAIWARHVERFRPLLDAAISNKIYLVKADEVAQIVFGKKISSQRTMQRIRQAIRDLGWEYNDSYRAWQPSKVVLETGKCVRKF